MRGVGASAEPLIKPQNRCHPRALCTHGQQVPQRVKRDDPQSQRSPPTETRCRQTLLQTVLMQWSSFVADAIDFFLDRQLIQAGEWQLEEDTDAGQASEMRRETPEPRHRSHRQLPPDQARPNALSWAGRARSGTFLGGVVADGKDEIQARSVWFRELFHSSRSPSTGRCAALSCSNAPGLTRPAG